MPKPIHVQNDDVDYWLDRLEGVRRQGHHEWMAICPAHNDRTPSLSIAEAADGTVLMHCFAGCNIHEIVDAIESKQVAPVVRGLHSRTTLREDEEEKRTGYGLWLELFGFDPIDLDNFFVGGVQRHVKILPDRIEFVWPSYPSAQRIRLANPSEGSKGYLWGRRNGLHPPLWPEVEEVVDSEIYLTEGESDCIVLRRCGLNAYALTTGGTRGEKPRFSSAVLQSLVDRGAKTIYLAFDDDDVGHQTAAVVFQQLMEIEKTLPVETSINVRILPIVKMTHPFAGEKDIRQVWLRVNDPEAFAELFLQVKQAAEVGSTPRFLPMIDYLQKPIEALNWIVEGVAVQSGIGWISGYPKMGKSFLAIDLGISVATGSPFLNHFPVRRMGDVLYIVKENSDASMINRLQKIASSKKVFDVRVWRSGQPIVSNLSSTLLIDASREFRFEPREVERVVQEMTRYEASTGRKIVLVIVDPLSFSLPVGKFDINTFTDFQTKIVDPISHIIRRTGASVFVVHHQSKGDNHTMLGSIAAEASFDDKISFLTKARTAAEYTPGDPVVLQISHRDGSVVSLEAQFTITDSSYDVSVTPLSGDEVRDRVNASLAGNKPTIRVSYAERQQAVADTILSLWKVGEELSYIEVRDRFRQVVSEEEVSRSLFENAFSAITRSTGSTPAVAPQVKKGRYKRE